MESNFFKRTLTCLFFVLMTLNITSLAQVSFRNSIINIGGATENGKFNFLINGYSGLSWTFDGGNKFFHCDVTSANPRLSGTGNEIVFYNTFTHTFNNIQVAEVYNYSDERAKTNIKTIDNGLTTILNLRPVSYNWKQTMTLSRTSEKTDLAADVENEHKTKIGFIAQEVEKIFPEAVMTDTEGRKLINYVAIIPLLVQSIQELQSQVNEQATIIERLNTSLQYDVNSTSITDIIQSCVFDVQSKELVVELNLSQTSNDADIIISDLIGSQKKTISCCKESPHITENVSNLNAGIHIATLVVDGVVKDSKQFNVY